MPCLDLEVPLLFPSVLETLVMAVSFAYLRVIRLLLPSVADRSIFLVAIQPGSMAQVEASGSLLVMQLSTAAMLPSVRAQLSVLSLPDGGV